MRRALGKGFAELVGEQFDSGIIEVEITSVSPNRQQPRTVFEDDALTSLAESIKQVGILQPIVVRPMTDGAYEIIAGERRYRAAKQAGLKSVPVIVRSAGHQVSLELALIENLQREDIGPAETARAYRRLVEEFGLTQDQVATKVGRSRVSVTNLLRLLKLPPKILQALDDRMLQEGHARALLGLREVDQQLALFELILDKELSVRDVERAVTQINGGKPKKDEKPVNPARRPYDLVVLESLRERLSAPVEIERKGKKGRLVIEFYDDEDLERVISRMGINR
ncbi:MAG: ParB/RepB/Spo0J family partition protein [Armatimonadetes bacterium]|nr:ParB/RepB/Spo0J family partition protein [Armatimonadota bacterium]